MPDAPPIRLLLWQAGTIRCAAPIGALRAVLAAPPVTAIPGVGRAIRGVINVRGEVVTLVDCRALLGEPDAEPGPEVVLVETGGRRIGLAVDAVEDLVLVEEAALVPDAAGRWTAAVEPGPAARVLDLEALIGPLFP